jgi:hypothetical protein
VWFRTDDRLLKGNTLLRASVLLSVATGERIGALLRFLRQPVPTSIVAIWAALGMIVAPLIARLGASSRVPLVLRVATSSLLVAAVVGWVPSRLPPEPLSVHVDEAIANLEAMRHKRLHVYGCLTPDSLKFATTPRGEPTYRFWIESAPGRPFATMEATYTGFVPDSFRWRKAVVLFGSLAPDGRLDVTPDSIMTTTLPQWAPSTYHCSLHVATVIPDTKGHAASPSAATAQR